MVQKGFYSALMYHPMYIIRINNCAENYEFTIMNLILVCISTLDASIAFTHTHFYISVKNNKSKQKFLTSSVTKQV